MTGQAPHQWSSSSTQLKSGKGTYGSVIDVSSDELQPIEVPLRFHLGVRTRCTNTGPRRKSLHLHLLPNARLACLLVLRLGLLRLGLARPPRDSRSGFLRSPRGGQHAPDVPAGETPLVLAERRGRRSRDGQEVEAVDCRQARTDEEGVGCRERREYRSARATGAILKPEGRKEGRGRLTHDGRSDDTNGGVECSVVCRFVCDRIHRKHQLLFS